MRRGIDTRFVFDVLCARASPSQTEKKVVPTSQLSEDNCHRIPTHSPKPFLRLRSGIHFAKLTACVTVDSKASEKVSSAASI